MLSYDLSCLSLPGYFLTYHIKFSSSQAMSYLLLYCLNKTESPRQFRKENMEFGTHGSRTVEFMNIILGKRKEGQRQLCY